MRFSDKIIKTSPPYAFNCLIGEPFRDIDGTWKCYDAATGVTTLPTPQEYAPNTTNNQPIINNGTNNNNVNTNSNMLLDWFYQRPYVALGGVAIIALLIFWWVKSSKGASKTRTEITKW